MLNSYATLMKIILYHSHSQKRCKHMYLSALPHAALLGLLWLRGSNPLFVASVTPSKLETPAQKAAEDKFCIPYFESYSTLSAPSATINLDLRLFHAGFAHPQTDVTRFHWQHSHSIWTSLQGPVGCWWWMLFSAVKKVIRENVMESELRESSTYHQVPLPRCPF